MIDVVIPTFNRARFLGRAIRSVFRQTFRQYILWVVDDGSTDNTSPVLNTWQALFPQGQMRVIKLVGNKGVSFARNTGIRAGCAPYLAFLDSDDEWMTDKLARQMEWVKKHPVRPLIHTEEIWIRNGRRVNQKKKHQKKGGRVFMHSLEFCRISPSSAMIKRSFLNSIGLFREDFPVCEDYELWLRVSARAEVGFIKQPLIIKYGGHAGQLSKKYKAVDEWRVRAMALLRDSPFISGEEKQQLIETLRKKCRILLKGYKKHSNFAHFAEIQKIYEDTQKQPKFL